MKVSTFRSIMSAWNDSNGPSVVLHLKGGGKMQGIVRNEGYDESLPPSMVSLSTPDGDVGVDINSIVGVQRFDWRR